MSASASSAFTSVAPAPRPLAPAGLLSARFWAGYAVTLRPYLLFVSGAAGLVGAAAARPVPAGRVAAAFAACFASYGLGQALTDVFQTDTDARSSPYRPLVRGEIGKPEVLGVSLSGLVLCGVTLAVLNPWNLALAGAAIAGLLAYTPLKRRFWGGPPCNAAVVALLPAMGFLAGEPSPARALASPLFLPASASVFFSYAVFVLLGYLKDVDADRATGYSTLAVRFGRRATVAVSGACAAASLLASGLLVVRAGGVASGAQLPGAFVWVAGAGLLAAAHVVALGVARDEEAHPSVALSVRGFLALHLGAAALLDVRLAIPALVLLVLFERTLAARPCREQV